MLGVASSETTFAGPLQLDADGLSASAIGLVFSAAAVVWIGAAWLASRIKGAHIRPRLAGLGVLALRVAWSLPTASHAALVVGLCLLRFANCRAPLNAFIYVLGQRGESASTTGAGAQGACGTYEAMVLSGLLAVWGDGPRTEPTVECGLRRLSSVLGLAWGGRTATQLRTAIERLKTTTYRATVSDGDGGRERLFSLLDDIETT